MEGENGEINHGPPPVEPINIKTEKIESEKPVKNPGLNTNTIIQEDYILIFGKKKYSFSFDLSEDNKKIIIQAKINSNKSKQYMNEYSLEDLKNLHRFFKMFDTIEVVIDFLKKITKKDGLVNLKKNKSSLSFNFTDNLINENIEIKLLEKKEKNCSYNEIKKIEQVIEELKNSNKNEIENLKNKIEEIKNSYDDKIASLNNEINYLKKDIQNKNELIDKIVKKTGIDRLFSIKSKILDKPEEINLIERKLEEIYKVSKEEFQYKLLYRATEDGGEPENFHKKCDGSKYTISIIKTKEGSMFGGFTEQLWNHNNCMPLKDENSFCFSINNKKIFKSKGRFAICPHKDRSLSFYDGIITVGEKGEGSTEPSSSWENYNEEELFVKKKNFVILEIEVYQLEK